MKRLTRKYYYPYVQRPGAGTKWPVKYKRKVNGHTLLIVKAGDCFGALNFQNDPDQYVPMDSWYGTFDEAMDKINTWQNEIKQEEHD